MAVPAFGRKFRTFIETSVLVNLQDGQFFCQAQLTMYFTAALWFSFANDGPLTDCDLHPLDSKQALKALSGVF